MITCPHCEHANSEEAKFCNNCGGPLLLICPNCATPNRAPANFCSNCGHTLSGTAAAPEPPPPALEPSTPSPSAERRVVTALFCDVVGSTALGSRLDPEEWTDIMNGMFQFMIASVERYEGTVARLMGDGILALFGAPVAHEDDPFRAVLAGLDILEEIRPYQQAFWRRLEEAGTPAGADEFQVRVGINSGLAVVGQVGTGGTGEYTAMGDAVNLAARMEQLALPGTIQIGHDTFRAIAPLVEVEALGPVQVKGKGGPVLAYRVSGLKQDRGRRRGPKERPPPIAGRARELSLMRDARAQLLDGSGRIITVIGEAGLGKSRLIEEFKAFDDSDAKGGGRESHARGRLRLLEAESLSFEGDKPYGLMQRLLRRLANIAANELASVTTSKIAALVRLLPQGQQLSATRALEALFHFGEDQGSAPVQGEELQNELLETLLALGRALASDAPTALVFEDLHWADAASAEIVRQMLPLVDELPLLLICAFRPERHSPAWKVKQTAEVECPHRYLEMNLKPLSAEETDLLVGHLLQMEQLPQQLGPFIRQKSDGVPFFVEEIVRDLIERGALEPLKGGGWRLATGIDELVIPENLEAVLLARIDRLQPGPRRTLQLAAVIGRTFFRPVLAMISGDQHQLDHDLVLLQRSGMIHEIARSPEVEYMFHHVLLQEAAYNTILRRQRYAYHKRIGEAIEQLFAGSLGQHASLMAHHFSQANEPARAFPYSVMAAEYATRLYANEEAIDHYDDAIEAAQGTPSLGSRLASLHLARGRLSEVTGRFEQALTDHEVSLRLTREAGDHQSEWRALLELGKLWSSRDYRKTGDYFQEALALARLETDSLMLANSLNQLGNWHANTQAPLRSLPLHQEALGIFEELGDKNGLADTLDLLGMGNSLIGRIDTAVEAFERAIQLYRELDNEHRLATSLASRAAALSNEFLGHELATLAEKAVCADEALQLSRRIGWFSGQAMAYMAKSSNELAVGQYGAALEHAMHGMQVSEAIGHQQWLVAHHHALGLLHCHLLVGQPAVEHAGIGLDLAQEVGSTFWTYLTAGALAHAHIVLEDYASCLQALERVRISETPMDAYGMRYCWAMKAEAALRLGDAASALEITERIIAATSAFSPAYIPIAVRRVRAEALAQLGRAQEAEDLLARGLVETSERDPLKWRLNATLGRLLSARGMRKEAESQFAVGWEQVERLAGSLPDGALKDSFRDGAAHLLSAVN